MEREMRALNAGAVSRGARATAGQKLVHRS